LIAELFLAYRPKMHQEDETDLQVNEDQSTIPPMTVCIAAICDKGKAVVMAADRGVTHGNQLSSDGPDRKINEVAYHAAIAVANQPLGANFVGQFDPKELSKLTVKEVANKICAALQALRIERIEIELLARHGKRWLNYASFENECYLAREKTPILGELWQKVNDYDLKSRVIVAGVDNQGAMIYKTTNEMQSPIPQEQPGFVAIGSGEGLAMGKLMSRSRLIKECPVAEALYFVYEAKKMAELAPGVGKETDLLIIRDGVKWINKSAIQELDMVHSKMNQPNLDQVEIELINRCL
jgi:20S proteasome alpha/beta subunit